MLSKPLKLSKLDGLINYCQLYGTQSPNYGLEDKKSTPSIDEVVSANEKSECKL